MASARKPCPVREILARLGRRKVACPRAQPMPQPTATPAAIFQTRSIASHSSVQVLGAIPWIEMAIARLGDAQE
jgi:hypothetical protein